MSREVDRLQVVIEGDNKKLKQSARESKKVVQDLAKSTDSALKQVRTNPLRDALKSDPAADGWRKQLDAVKSTVRQSMAQVDAMRSAIRNFTTEAKLQAGLIGRPTRTSRSPRTSARQKKSLHGCGSRKKTSRMRTNTRNQSVLFRCRKQLRTAGKSWRSCRHSLISWIPPENQLLLRKNIRKWMRSLPTHRVG